MKVFGFDGADDVVRLIAEGEDPGHRHAVSQDDGPNRRGVCRRSGSRENAIFREKSRSRWSWSHPKMSASMVTTARNSNSRETPA